jgi:hypothetical protein
MTCVDALVGPGGADAAGWDTVLVPDGRFAFEAAVRACLSAREARPDSTDLAGVREAFFARSAFDLGEVLPRFSRFAKRLISRFCDGSHSQGQLERSIAPPRSFLDPAG